MTGAPKASPDPHMARIWREAAIGLGGGLLLIAAPLVLFGPAQPDLSAGARILGWTGCIAAGVVWAMVFAVRVFAYADEYIRDRDKTAWLWGGLFGVAVSAPIYVFVMLGGLHWLDPARPASRALAQAFGEGYGLVIACQLAGYFAFAAWRRFAGR